MRKTRLLLITGARGWIGNQLCSELSRLQLPWQAWPRQHFAAGEWPDVTIDAVVHLAAIAHQPDGRLPDTEYFRVNRDLAVQAGKLARAHGVRRFIFVSTVKVMGERSTTPWRETDHPTPVDAYGKAKLQAERELLALHEPGTFEVVVIRPPLVWGPGAKANFARLLKLGLRRIPLPFSNLNAPRSSVFLEDFVGALVHLIDAQDVGGRVFFVADETDRGTADWIRLIRGSQQRSPWLFPAPWGMIQWLARLFGQGQKFDRAYERLACPLQIDSSALRQTGWQNVANPQQAMTKTCNRLFGRSGAE